MQKRLGYSSFFIIFLLQTLLGCTPARLLSKPEWRLQGIRIDRIDLTGASLGLALRIINPNPVGVTVQHLTYQFYLHEVKIAEGEVTTPFELPRHESIDVVLPVQMSFKEARELAPLLRKEMEEIDYRLEGEIALRAMGTEKHFQLHHAGKR
jgi:LEA14-like dessication related protein